MTGDGAIDSRGADVLIAKLAEAGVDKIFALSGNQIMPVFDACIDSGIEIIHTRHEAAAVYMAEAYAQVSGKPGVALVTAGTGAGNTVGALFSASESQTPLLLLSGDSPLSQDTKGAFQELDQVSMTRAVTRWSHRVTAAETISEDIDNALETAAGPHSGPVHLVLPVDVLNQQTTHFVARTRTNKAAEDFSVQPIVDLLASAKKPLIVCGPPLSNTRQPGLVGQLTASTGAPAVVMESPRGLNDPCLGAFKTIIHEADVIVSLGKRIDFSIGFGNDTHGDWVVVAGSTRMIEQAQQNLKDKLVCSVLANPLQVASALVNESAITNYDAWPGRVQEQVLQRVDPIPATPGKITPTELCTALQDVIDQSTDPVLICDGGEFGQWAQACLTAPRRVINGLSGSIGGGVNYGIGAATALPGSTVFVLSGDGSLGFHLAEFETAVRNGVSFVVVIGNDLKWNAEHQLQLKQYGSDRLYACDLTDMQYHVAVEAMGGFGKSVTDIESLPSVLYEAVKCGVVACIDVKIAGEPAPNIQGGS